MDLITALEGLAPELERGLDQASSLEDLEGLRVDFLGRKGRLAQIMGRLPQLAPEQRPAVGQAANTVKERCNALFEARKKRFGSRTRGAGSGAFRSLPAGTRALARFPASHHSDHRGYLPHFPGAGF